MNKNQTINAVETQHAAFLPSTATEQQYVAPNIEIIDIEMQQNILGGSGTADDMSGEGW